METTATMTPIASTRPAARPQPALLAGAGNIFGKEVQEWFRTRRFLMTSILTTLLAGIGPVWIFVHDGGLRHGRFTISHATYNGLFEAWIALSLTLGTFLLVALTMGILIKEEETGTAQWVFTKPVSRAAYGLAKWAANSFVAVVAAVLIPGAVFLALMQALFSNGVSHWSGILGALAITSFHAAVIIAIIMALSVIFRSQAPVAGVVIGVTFLSLTFGRLVAGQWSHLFPVYMGPLATQAAQGAHMGPWEPLVTSLIALPLCVAFACYRLTRKQLQ